MCCSLHGSFAEAAAQQRAKVAKHRLAADDEDPGIHNGVEGVEAEGCQVLIVTTKWVNGINKTCNLKRKRVGVRHCLCCTPCLQIIKYEVLKEIMVFSLCLYRRPSTGFLHQSPELNVGIVGLRF